MAMAALARTRNPPCTRGLRGEVRNRSVVRALIFLRKRGRKWHIMVSREFCVIGSPYLCY